MSNTIAAVAAGYLAQPGPSMRAAFASAASPLAEASAAPADTIMSTLRSAHGIAIQRLNSLVSGTPQATIDRLFAETLAIEEQAMAAPIVTARDCAAAVAIFADRTRDCVPGEDDLSFLARAADTLARLARADATTQLEPADAMIAAAAA
ncbi:hypothetical protein GGR25_002260 [Kaistia hirudinis]|uniref:Uncharacterized protein n=1 Tax=Kaistia hirudinis TaxID=1293440 RepID=A0A840ALN9_9HYPH|nr:hypothetical protein [Kaistia hirudinis]MBB3931210.1 hypothetical protein [Kaistia hirudinis]